MGAGGGGQTHKGQVGLRPLELQPQLPSEGVAGEDVQLDGAIVLVEGEGVVALGTEHYGRGEEMKEGRR